MSRFTAALQAAFLFAVICLAGCAGGAPTPPASPRPITIYISNDIGMDQPHIDWILHVVTRGLVDDFCQRTDGRGHGGYGQWISRIAFTQDAGVPHDTTLHFNESGHPSTPGQNGHDEAPPYTMYVMPIPAGATLALTPTGIYSAPDGVLGTDHELKEACAHLIGVKIEICDGLGFYNLGNGKGLGTGNGPGWPCQQYLITGYPNVPNVTLDEVPL